MTDDGAAAHVGLQPEHDAELIQLQAKLDIMKQIQALQQQIDNTNITNQNDGTPVPRNAQVKNVKVPEGRYHMSISEYRTDIMDCIAYRTLTGYSDEQVVMHTRTM